MITITEFLLKKQGDGRILPKTIEELKNIILNLCNQDIYDLNCIDTSKIIDMKELFDMVDGIGSKINMSKINISNWDVSKVKYMNNMFWKCESFNCDISNWDVSNVTDMAHMFLWCESFNCDLSNWNVSNVTDMKFMFDGCNSFNCDLSRWNVSKVKSMRNMFNKCPAPKPDWYINRYKN